MLAGSVLSLHRWPVKSLAGEQADALALDVRGVAGDRAHALYDEFRGHPRRLTVRQVPRMLRWRAAYRDGEVTPDGVPVPTLTAPDGAAYRWDDPALAGALAEDLGRPVELRRDLGLMQDVRDTIHVTTQATLAALGEELGRPLDVRRFRPNVHVALDAAPYAEQGWTGRRLRVGGVVLELLDPCERCVIPTRDPETTVKDPEILRRLARQHDTCFGIYARAAGPGRIAAGDPVELLPA
ncbi:MAG TPA: MOSC domain-containing protein [Baekduia sp.]|nr:MOSC domain-containing protein [Baekduia sp.]